MGNHQAGKNHCALGSKSLQAQSRMSVVRRTQGEAGCRGEVKNSTGEKCITAPQEDRTPSIDVHNLQKTGQRENLMDHFAYTDSLDASTPILHLLCVGEKNAQAGRGDVIDL